MHQIKVIDTAGGFAGLAGQWNRLLEISGINYPFLTFEWQFAWFTSFGADTKPCIVVMLDGAGEICAIAPFHIVSKGGFRIVRFIAAERSDCLDIITCLDKREVLPAICAHLVSYAGWDILDLKNILMEEELLKDIRANLRKKGFCMAWRFYIRSPYLPVDKGWDEYLAERGKEFKKQVIKKERRLENKGAIEIIRTDEFICSDPRIGDISETAQKIEKRSWKYMQNSPRILTSEASRRFYRDFLSLFAKNGWLNSWFACLDGEPVAYAFDLKYKRKIWAYNSAFNEEHKEKGIGALMRIKRLRHAFESGQVAEYDFLRGEESYKMDWAAGARNVKQAIIYHNRRPKAVLGSFILYRFRWLIAKSALAAKLKNRLFGATGSD